MFRVNRLMLVLSATGLVLAAAATLRLSDALAAPGASGYQLAKTIAVGGDEGWDYLAVDSAARRVYVSHGSHVVVLDADSFAVAGEIGRASCRESVGLGGRGM